MPLNLTLLRGDLATLIPEPPPIPLPLPGTVQIVTGPGLVGFKLNGVLRWLVDEKWFGGTPVLTYGPLLTGYRIELKGALYAGTSLTADFVMTLAAKTATGTPMDMTMSLGGFHGQSVLERWLAGSQRLASPVTLAATACPLGAAGKLTVQNAASALFAPEWQTTYAGTGIAAVTGLGAAAQSANNFLLRVLTPGQPSLRSTPKQKRTLMTLHRGSLNWDLKPSPLALDIGTLTPQPNLFDEIDIEAGENSATDVDHTLLAQSTSADKLAFAPGGGITNLDGHALIVPLGAARFAIDFETNQTFLSSQFPAIPLWLQRDGFALQVGNPAGASAFELDATSGTVTTHRCAPALLQAAAPLAGAAAATPLALSGTSRLNFVAKPGTTPGWGVLAAAAIATQPTLSLPEFAVALLRRDDLLVLDFLFGNLALEGGGGLAPRLARIDATADGLLTARFNGPQNIVDQAFPEVPPPLPASPPVQALAAGPSRLVFKLGAGVSQVPYDLAGLLQWVAYDLNVSRAAALPDPPPQPLSGPAPTPPQPTETAIEAPWSLFLSPNATAGWANQTDAVTHGTQTELWHTRLGVKKIQGGVPIVDEQSAATRTVRALWSPDYRPGPPPTMDSSPFLMSLSTMDRDQIVVRSSDFSNPQLPPKAVQVDRLMLSSLGAWLDLDGRWPPGGAFTIVGWRHRAATGRDNYVKVIDAAFACPVGNRAVRVKVTERKFLDNPTGPTTAYQMQRHYVVITEPEKDYTFLATTTASGGRNFPFKKIRITTLVTPNLDTPPGGNWNYFIPTVSGQPFLFHIVATDWDGNNSDFSMPLVIALSDMQSQTGGYALYTGSDLSIRQRDMGGQSIAFAASTKPGGTTFNTSTMTFNAALFNVFIPPPPGQPIFYPILDTTSAAQVTIPALQQVTGASSPVQIVFYPHYIQSNFDKGGVFIQLVNALGVAFGGDKTGGVATPNLNVGGLSRDFGTVSGTGGALDTFSQGKFDPKQYFGAIADAKLLGVVPLSDVIQVILDITGAPEKAPQLVTTRSPTQIVTTLAWKPDVQDWAGGVANLHFTAPDAPKNLELDVVITTPIGGGTPDATVTGHMRSFDLELLSVIKLHFNSVDFTASPGKKLDLSANMGDIGFEGDLAFLNQLEQLIPSSGFSDPPAIEVTSQGVTVGYSLAIPSIGVGVFSIENIRLGAALELSFVGNPIRFRFAFSERQHPFLVSVSLLGGGGFFGLELGPDGIEMLEASIEFGANVSIDLVVASANVHIMAGVYLKLDFATQHSQLTGYLRAGGSANVLGLITLSVEFYLGFTFYPAGGGAACKIAGEASVTVEVDVLMFSASVSLSLRREFGDPTVSFADLIAAGDWNEYCDAFAA
ncbi:hypothetical protein [Bradyrhizobium sp. AZCC 2289]|uniref:hypothetical protein n=1 Tax=Bradyrhizobium sp. AZCC 2289 TaxID=3117026 RepID=UPI002FF0FB1F